MLSTRLGFLICAFSACAAHTQNTQPVPSSDESALLGPLNSVGSTDAVLMKPLSAGSDAEAELMKTRRRK